MVPHRCRMSTTAAGLFVAATSACMWSLASAQRVGGEGSSWVLIGQEAAGANGSDIMRTLGFTDVPDFYRVRMEWGPSFSEFAEFNVPPDTTIFGDYVDPSIPLSNLSTSAAMLSSGGAVFCKMCSNSSAQHWGDTCWALLPADELHRQCGCNSGGWAGRGVYYGGYDSCNACGCRSPNAFSGEKTNGEAKGGVLSTGLRIYVMVDQEWGLEDLGASVIQTSSTAAAERPSCVGNIHNLLAQEPIHSCTGDCVGTCRYPSDTDFRFASSDTQPFIIVDLGRPREVNRIGIQVGAPSAHAVSSLGAAIFFVSTDATMQDWYEYGSSAAFSEGADTEVQAVDGENHNVACGAATFNTGPTGSYVLFPQGHATCPVPHGYLKYPFFCSCPTHTCNVRFRASVVAPNGNADSLFISVDHPLDAPGTAFSAPEAWHTGQSTASAQSTASPQFTVRSGQHYLYIGEREDGISISTFTFDQTAPNCLFGDSTSALAEATGSEPILARYVKVALPPPRAGQPQRVTVKRLHVARVGPPGESHPWPQPLVSIDVDDDRHIVVGGSAGLVSTMSTAAEMPTIVPGPDGMLDAMQFDNHQGLRLGTRGVNTDEVSCACSVTCGLGVLVQSDHCFVRSLL
eukprot:SAG25_NODE_701_length_5875_cov_2.089681_2_plen_628_part_00